MPYQATEIADLVAGTLRELGRMKFQQIAQSLSEYEVFPHWFKKDKVTFDSGVGIQRTLMNRLSGAASHVGLYEVDNVNIADVIDQLNVPWVHATTSWGFEYRETLMNRGEALIFNIVKPRRTDAMISLVEELENKAWASPTSSSDKKVPYGLPYWIVKNSSTGFNGGAPSGWTDVAGVSLTDSPTFKNYTFQYAAFTKADAIKKLRTAHRACNFKSPLGAESDYRNGATVNRYRLYCNEATYSSVEDIGEAQNENLGRDIASMDGGDMAFRGHPIRYARKLDADTTNPIYGVDHSTFMPVCLKGDYLRESEPKQAPNQHNAFQVFVDITYNYLCVDRRRNFVGYI